jgi:glycosyltransferase involved in cell wall biosynthesis
MTRVAVAVLAAEELMGQQRYEHELLGALSALPTGQLDVRRLAVQPMRSRLPAERRAPLQRIPVAGPITTLAATWLYRGADVVHRCDLRLPPARRPEVLTVHDLAFERYDDEGVVRPGALAAARRSRVILTPSSFVADEVRSAVPHADVRVALNGVSHDVFTAGRLTAEDRQRLCLPGAPYVVHSGGATKRKNLAQLAAAWAELSRELPDVQLVLTGPADARRTDLFADLSRTHLLGQIDRELQLRVLTTAAAVIVPSLYEGFGLPALEGMAAAVPTVVAAGSSLSEVVGDAGIVVAGDADGLADGLRQVLTDQQLARRLAEAGPTRARTFTWSRTAQVHLQAYADAARR